MNIEGNYKSVDINIIHFFINKKKMSLELDECTRTFFFMYTI